MNGIARRGNPLAGGAGPWLAPGSEGGTLLPAALLLGLGVVMSYSATAPLSLDTRLPPHFLRHLGAVIMGGLAAYGTAQVPLRFWERTAWPLWIGGVALMVLTALFGVEVNGARRWLALPGGPRFQPGELVKLVTLIAAASVLARRRAGRELARGHALAAVLLALVPALLLLDQPDLGGAVMLLGLVWLMLVAAGLPWRLWLGPVLTAPLGVGLYAWTNPYAWRRLVAFWDPWADARDAGFQLVQSFLAFAQGGLTGVGLGNGRQKLFYLPEAHTDFILALIAEELGLLGVLLVLAAFAALWTAGLRVARRSSDRFGLLLAFGMTGLVTLPAAVNAAVVMGLLPTKGLTLPFLSYGRTSLIASCIALGLVWRVARETAAVPVGRRRPAWR
ncbi:MAG: putative lipid II flippase FtsW [Myxococcota bacterium]